MGKFRSLTAALTLALLVACPAAAQLITWDADQVTFDDAETLQAKYDAGDLDPPRTVIDLPSFAGQHCGENGCYEADGINWIPLHPYAQRFGYVGGNTVMATSNVDCGDTPNDLVKGAAGAPYTVTLDGTNFIEIATGDEADFCRTTAPAANPACGGATYYATCTTGASCAAVETAALAGSVVIYDVSADQFAVGQSKGYQGCNGGSDRIDIAGWDSSAVAGDLVDKVLPDAIHPSEMGALWIAQRVLDARRPEVIKNPMFPWGDGEDHPETPGGSPVAAITKWQIGGGAGALTAPAYDPLAADLLNATVSAEVGKAVQSVLGVGGWMETAPMFVTPGVYQWKCSVVDRGTTSSQIHILDETSTLVAAADRDEKEEKFGRPWADRDWATGRSWRLFENWGHAIGLVRVTDQTALKIRIVGADASTVTVDDCLMERAPVQVFDLDHSDQYRLPDGDYAVQFSGDSRGNAGYVPGALDELQNPSGAWNAAPFRTGVTFTNGVASDTSYNPGQRVSNVVGELSTVNNAGSTQTDDCEGNVDPLDDAAPASTLIAATLSDRTKNLGIFQWGINDLLSGRVWYGDRAKGDCQNLQQTMRDLRGVLRNGQTSLNLYIGELPTRTATGGAANPACFQADAITRTTCDDVFHPWFNDFAGVGQ